MKPIRITLISIVIAVFCQSCSLPASSKTARDGQAEQIQSSLVSLRISVSGYEQFQPWKRTEVAEKIGYGCAVAPYQILTTASNVINATTIQAKRFGKNDYIQATIKAVDYEYNLCLLELDNAAAGDPLTPLLFEDIYNKGNDLDIYWLSVAGQVTSARGTLDRAQCDSNPVSFTRTLNFILTNASRTTSFAEVVCDGKMPVGIVNWTGENQLGIIPSEQILRFLAETEQTPYAGFGIIGFESNNLIDPSTRNYLKMPAEMQDGIYVSRVNTLGTGSDELKKGDVVLSINGYPINAYGKYAHPRYDRITFDHLIGSQRAGQILDLEVFRGGKIEKLPVVVKNFKAEEMLVPYYEYDKQPEYVMTGGFVFQKLTRDYYKLWGENWSGKVSPHLYQYYYNDAFRPAEDRKDIVILSFVLPAPINQGYNELGRLVVSTFNDKKIQKIEDILEAQKAAAMSPFDVVEFEMYQPKVIIPRENLTLFNEKITQIYGIDKLYNIR